MPFLFFSAIVIVFLRIVLFGRDFAVKEFDDKLHVSNMLRVIQNY